MAVRDRSSENPRRAICVATMTDAERDELLEAIEANFGLGSDALPPTETGDDDFDER